MGGADAGDLKQGGLPIHAHDYFKDLMFDKDEEMARIHEVAKFLIKTCVFCCGVSKFGVCLSSLHLGVEGSGYKVVVVMAAFQIVVEVEVGERKWTFPSCYPPLFSQEHSTDLQLGKGDKDACSLTGRGSAFWIAECIFLSRLFTTLCSSRSLDFKEWGPMSFRQLCVCDFMNRR